MDAPVRVLVSNSAIPYAQTPQAGEVKGFERGQVIVKFDNRLAPIAVNQNSVLSMWFKGEIDHG